MSGPVRLRHLPTEADGWLFDGTNAIDIAHWLNGDGYISADGELVLHTYQGDITPDIGDTVMRGPESGVYPIKPAVRAACWTEVEG